MGRTYIAFDCRNPSNIAERTYAAPNPNVSAERAGANPGRLDKIFPVEQLRLELSKAFNVASEATAGMDFNKFKNYVGEQRCDWVNPCCSFAFSKLTRNSVIVNVGVGGPGASHDTLRETPLTLPVPPRYKQYFVLASSGKAGFLESNRPAVLRSLSTSNERSHDEKVQNVSEQMTHVVYSI